MKDANLIIRKSDLEIILAKFYRLKDVSVEGYSSTGLNITANYPKKRRKK